MQNSCQRFWCETEMHCGRVCKRCRIPVRDSDVSQGCTVYVRDAEFLSRFWCKSDVHSVCWSYRPAFRGAPVQGVIFWRCRVSVAHAERLSEVQSVLVRCRTPFISAECLKKMQSFRLKSAVSFNISISYLPPVLFFSRQSKKLQQIVPWNIWKERGEDFKKKNREKELKWSENFSVEPDASFLRAVPCAYVFSVNSAL